MAVLAAGICMRYRLYIVRSGSMEPVLPVGSIIIVDIHDKEAEPGEILTYYMGETVVTHRAVGRVDGRYITKGDANREQDFIRTEPEKVIGTVCGQIPYLGNLILKIKRLPGMMAENISVLSSEINGR